MNPTLNKIIDDHQFELEVCYNIEEGAHVNLTCETCKTKVMATMPYRFFLKDYKSNLEMAKDVDMFARLHALVSPKV